MIIRFFYDIFETWDSLDFVNAKRCWTLNAYLKLKMA